MPFNCLSNDYVGRLYVDEYLSKPEQYDPIRCIDETCSRPELSVVRNNVPRPFFRHGHGASCSRGDDQDAHQNAMSEWHRDWQTECDDRTRVEYLVHYGERRVENDVHTKFGWAVEFQHSHIKQSDVRVREDAMQGKVIWLVDATPNNQGVGLVSEMPKTNAIEWFQPPTWAKWINCVVAIDTGESIYVLPSGRAYGASHSTYPKNQVVTMTRSQFIDSWINGDTEPSYCKLKPQFATKWHWNRSEAAVLEKKKREERIRLRALELRGRLSTYVEPASCRWSIPDHLEGEDRQIEQSAIEQVEEILVKEQQTREIERLRRAALKARQESDAIRWAEQATERSKKAQLYQETKQAWAERKQTVDIAWEPSESHQSAMTIINSVIGIASYDVVPKEYGERLTRMQPHGKPEYHQYLGPCAKCHNTYEDRYGPDAFSTLCPQCEGAA